jgi:hypothetical protein
MRCCARTLLALLVLGQSAFALCNATSKQRHEFQFLVGYSPNSNVAWGTSDDRGFAQAGFAYSYRCWHLGSMSISYTGTVLPLAMVFQPTYEVTEHLSPTVTRTRTIPAHRVYGAGVLPLGFTVDFAQQRRVSPFAEAHGGIIASKEPVPYDEVNGTGLNFLLQFGGGIKWRLKESQAFRFGYRLAHISNANTTDLNPGIDNNVLYVSWSVMR